MASVLATEEEKQPDWTWLEVLRLNADNLTASELAAAIKQLATAVLDLKDRLENLEDMELKDRLESLEDVRRREEGL